MPESAAPDPNTTARPPSSSDATVPPMPYPGATTAWAPSFPDGIVPPMPSEVTNGHDRTQRPAAGGMWRTAMMPLRKMMRRTPRGAA